jgi:hypothetical protein
MLFNKDSAGSSELKALIGFIYKSINFDNLKSYIGFAERDIKKIIGNEVFQVALDHYNSENYLLAEADEDHPEYTILDELVERIQYPVAIHAYRRYVPSSDLTHSDKGRQIFVSEQEKPAFEWQIEKDNENLLRLAHDGTDMLLDFLDYHKSTTALVSPPEGTKPPEEFVLLLPWVTSQAYLASKELFINTTDEFERIFMIGHSRLTFLSLVPIMRRVQDNELKSCFTAEKYDELVAKIIEDDISAENLIILDKARQPLALLTLSVAAKRLTSEILPDGIFANMTTSVIKSKSPAAKIDRNEVSANLEKDGLRELRKLQDHLAKLAATAAGVTVEPVDLLEHIDETDKFVRL